MTRVVLAVAAVVYLMPGRALAGDGISAVEVVGNRTVDADSIRSHLPLGKGGAKV